MSDNIDPQLYIKASNPDAAGEELQVLAVNPTLRPIIASNPAAYTGLLDWLAAKNEPEVNEALKQRQIEFNAGKNMAMPSQPIDLPATATNNTQNQNNETTAANNTETTNSQTTEPAPKKIIRTSILTDSETESTTDTTVINTVPNMTGPAALPPSYTPNSPSPAQREQHLRNENLVKPEQEKTKSTNTTLLWMIFGTLLLLVIVLGAMIGVLASGTGKNPEASNRTEPNPAQSNETAAKPTQDEPDTNEQSPSPSESATILPAPPEAQHATELTTASGNTSCYIEQGKLLCLILNHETEIGECTPDMAVAVTLEKETTHLECTSKSGYTKFGNTIDYGESITAENFACTSLEAGTQCWNTISGKGFFLARQEFRTIG